MKISLNLLMLHIQYSRLFFPDTVYLHSNFRCGLRKMHVFWNRVHNRIQGHPRSLILAAIKSTYATSYWSSIVTLVLSCPVLEILQVFCWEEQPHPNPPKFWGVTLGYLCMAPRWEDPTLIIRVINFELVQPIRPTLQMDGRTDGRTTYDSNTALCTTYIVR